jgi:diaminopimelate epimerase
MDYHSSMRIDFHKMHGTKNDFVVFHDLEDTVSLSAHHVAAICDRRTGVGADGVIVVRQSEKADFFMDYVNADGSVAEMCGNGVRCLAKYVYDNGLTEQRVLPVETRAGVKSLELSPGDDGRIKWVSVDMGKPIFEAQRIPVKLEPVDGPILDHPIEIDGRTFLGSMVSMGNPHCVILCSEPIEDLPKSVGPAIENHRIFPEKTNVEFVQVVDRTRLKMRVWERGSGETYSCGTGACGSAVIARLKGLVDAASTVELLGGDLKIGWEGPESSVIMTGTANTAFKGSINI